MPSNQEKTLAQDARPEERVQVQVRLPKGLDRALERAAFEAEISKQQLVEDAVRAHLAKKA